MAVAGMAVAAWQSALDGARRRGLPVAAMRLAQAGTDCDGNAMAVAAWQSQCGLGAVTAAAAMAVAAAMAWQSLHGSRRSTALVGAG